MADFSAGTWNELDSANTAPPPDGFPVGQAPSTLSGSWRNIAGAIKRFWNRFNAQYTSTGTAAALVLTFAQAPTAYTKGERIAFFSHVATTGATTLNINGLGAKSILRKDGSALAAGDIGNGEFTEVVFDGTNFRLAAAAKPSALNVGDFFETLLNLSSTGFLRRDGGIYNIADYPVLAALLPALPDGVNWTSISAPPTTGDVRTIISVPGGFMAAHDNGTNTVIYKSTDGVNWTVNATINTFRAYALVYGGGIYVCTDGNGYVSRSADGVTWSSPVLLSGVSTESFNGIAFGAGLFVAAGGTTGNVSKIYTSPDAVTWTTRTTGFTTGGLQTVKFVNNTFVAVGNGGVCTTSTNGTTWTVRTTGVSVALRDVTFGNSLFVIVGDTGTILTTSAFSTFSAPSSGTTQSLNAITYSTAGFLTVGGSGVARISTNATTWASSATGVANSFYCCISDPNNASKYYVTGNSAKFMSGLRTLPTQFAVPSDNATYGWVKALP